jgi:hypothetical protein
VADQDGLRVALVEIRQGRGAVLEVAGRVAELAASRRIAEVVYDPMRSDGEAMRLEREHGLPLVEWPQSLTRMTLCSETCTA